MTAEARDLVDRLRWLQQQRHEKTEVKDYRGARDALDIAVSLIDPAGLPVLREALLHVTNPANTPPLPVVLGPQDVAAVVGVDEVLALVAIYVEAAIAWKANPTLDATKLCQATHAAIREALQQLCRTAPAYELGGGRTS